MHSVLKWVVDNYPPYVLDQQLKELLVAADFGAIAKYRLDLSSYPTASAYAKDNNLITLIKKCKGIISERDLGEKAVETFFECEHACARTNARLHRFINNQGPFEPVDETAIRFFERWRKEVFLVIGRLPDDILPRFSGGSTYHDKGKLTTIPDKLTSKPHGTPSANSLFHHGRGNAWETMYRSVQLTPVRGNRFTSVPKDAFKNRGICVEPLVNVTLQLGIGRVLRDRLRRFGIDLDHNAELHQDLAQLGSLNGELATIDLSNASDTISRVLLEILLPEPWLMLLKSLRCPVTEIAGKTVHLHKFSSMGNGFTFELETLLFCTLCRALDAPCKVYGDDIIVYSDDYRRVAAALQFAGMQLNSDKSFSEGPFRESCGGDFFFGAPVRGPYMKKLPSEPADWITLHNTLQRVPMGGECFEGLKKLCISSLPVTCRLFGPSYLGDIVLHGTSYDVSMRPLRKFPEGNRIPQVKAWVPVAKKVKWSHFRPEVQLVAALLGGDPAGVQARDSISGYAVRWVPTHDDADPPAN